MKTGQLSRKRLTEETSFDSSQDHQDDNDFDDGNHHKRTKVFHSNRANTLPPTSTVPSLVRHSSSAMSIDDFDMMFDSAPAYSQSQSFFVNTTPPSVPAFVTSQSTDSNIDTDALGLDDIDESFDEDLPPSTTRTTTHDRAYTPGSIMNEMGKLELEVGPGPESQRNTTTETEKVVHGMLQPVGLGQSHQLGAGKVAKRFTMGYRVDCEKCRMKVPGHWAHPPGLS